MTKNNNIKNNGIVIGMIKTKKKSILKEEKIGKIWMKKLKNKFLNPEKIIQHNTENKIVKKLMKKHQKK